MRCLVRLSDLFEFTKVHDLFSELDAEALPDGHAAALDQPADVRRRRGAAVHDEVAVRRRDARAAESRPFQAGAVHERAGGPGDAVGQHVSTAAVGTLTATA